MSDPLKERSSVDFGGFILRHVDVGQCRHVDDDAPAGVLPDSGCDIDCSECGCVREVIGV